MKGRSKVSEIDSSLLLTSKDGVEGFSIMIDGRGNITLLRWGKRVAWFSAAVSEETVRAFLELMKACERSAKGGNVNVSKTEETLKIWHEKVHPKLAGKVSLSVVLLIGRAYRAGFLDKPIEEVTDAEFLSLYGCGLKRLSEIRQVILAGGHKSESEKEVPI